MADSLQTRTATLLGLKWSVPFLRVVLQSAMDNVNQLQTHIRCTWNELCVCDINMHTKGTRVGHDAKSLFGR